MDSESSRNLLEQQIASFREEMGGGVPQPTASPRPASRVVGFGGAPVSSPAGTPRDSRTPRTPRQRRSSGGRSPGTPGTPGSPSTPRSADRFVPTRGAMDFDLSYHQLTNENLATNSLLEDDYSSGVEYKSILSKMLFEGADKKILRFTAPDSPRSPSSSPHSQRALTNVATCEQAELRHIYHENMAHSPFSRMQHRQISHTPEKILDAPDLLDDYYLNLLDWSSKNVLAVALGQTVYLWNAHTGQISQLTQTTTTDDYVASLSFSADGSQIAVGTNSAQVRLFDVEKMKLIRSMKGHHHRVSSLAWNGNQLSSGSRDAMIFNHDVRATTHHQSTLQGHRQEVCGLRWSPDGKQLASGGNDNILNIWDHGRETPRLTFSQHCAAVKALAWCPFRPNLLASGGGTADRTIRFWNTSSGALRNTVDTKSQVCAIVWSKNEEELVSSHGFSHNQLTLWKYPSMVKMAELTGHTSRVLHLAQSPDGETVVSGAADETLRFWKVFGPAKRKSKASSTGGRGTFSMSGIR
eukprot:COSAG02_NODE_16_length_56207_cov_9.816122_23_plen_524_part_00